MSSHDDSYGKDFIYNDEDIRLAGIRVCEAISDNTSKLEYDDLQFSNKFLSQMDDLVKRSNKSGVKAFIRSAIAAILVLVIIGSVWVGTSPEARADLSLWVRSILGVNEVLYVFTSGNENSNLPSFELAWLPEEYSHIDTFESDRSVSIIFEDKAQNSLIFDCSIISTGMQMEIGGDSLQHKEVTVNDLPGELYLDSSDSSNTLVWLDGEKNVVFTLSGFISEKELIKVAENLRYS